ncbi:MAG: leucine-rich repeat domain-containing protein [Clostridia bacterium]|nr:leucine-rich repeat domain-containing protein [Clostridia bacterium]
MKKILIILLSAAAAVACAAGLTACSKHAHDYSAETEVAPTCTEKGYTLHTCACGESYKDNFVDATGHDYEADVKDVDPDCTEKGYTLHTCACGESYKDNFVDALGHTEVIDEGYEATCTKNGLTEGKHCSVCDTVITEQEKIPAGHFFENGKCIKCGLVETTEGLEYRLNDDGKSYSVCGIGTATDTAIVIPDEYLGLPVTAIGKQAFSGCEEITSITIPASITNIGEDAFTYSISFTGVYISDLESWCKISFADFSSNPLTYAHNLYVDNELLTDLVIPESITEIGKFAFADCTYLTSVTIHNNVSSIGESAFSGCYLLDCIYISDLVSWCNLSFEDIDSNPLFHGVKLYLNNQLVTDLVIPQSVKEIKNYAFAACESITSVTIPDSVTNIGYGAFAHCEGLESITVASGNTVYHSDGNCLIETASKTLIAGCKSSVIPDDGSVTVIGTYAFGLCTGLTAISIPDSITEIGSYAFNNCTSLTTVTIPDKLTVIGSYAFFNCHAVTSIVIPDTVTTIGNSAFGCCSHLTDIYYEGSEVDWSAIDIGINNEGIMYAKIHYNYNG